MERVVTINLNGNPYQLEEPAYDALRAYIGRAQSTLTDNPDKAEIVRDLEQAIADKCANYLSPSKSVVAADEMARILSEMGPVEGEDAGAQQSAGAQTKGEDEYVRPRRRLYRIYDRQAWTGVSAGLAAYAGIDVAWVRVLWLVSAVFSGGLTALIYLALVFAVPVAATSEEMAAAHGAPFNAQEVIDRAKHQYARFTEEEAPHWRAQWRAQRRAWRQQMRAWRRSWRNYDYGAGPTAAPPVRPVGYFTRVVAGLLAFVFSIITAALLIAFLLAFFSLLGAGSILGWAPPVGVPLWLAIVVLCIAYAAISAPFSALRRASYATVSGYRYGFGAADGLITVVIVAAAGWFAWMYIPDARQLMEQAYVVIRDFVSYWKASWNG